MTRKPKVQRKRVKALTDPQPEFVSLVTAGANMTPFKAMKADVAPEAAADVAEVSDVADSVEVQKAENHEIAKLVFAKSEFASVDAVKAWLTEGGYDSLPEVVETEDAFEVGTDDARATKVEHDGVTIFILEHSEDIAAPVEGQPSAVIEVEAAKADEAPVDVAVEAAPEAPVAVVASENVRKSMSTVPMLVELVGALKWVINDLKYENGDSENGDSEDSEDSEEGQYTQVIDALKGSANQMLGALASLFNIEVNEMQAVFKTAEAAPVVAEIEPVAEEVAKEEAPASESAEQPANIDVEAAKTEEVASAPVAPDLAAIVSQLATSVQELTNNFSNLHNQVVAKSESLAERVTAMESERQSRKGADVDDVVAETNGRKKSSSLADLSLRAALGIQRAAR